MRNGTTRSLPEENLTSLKMGEHKVQQNVDERMSHAFMQALLEDLRALAFMLEHVRVESGVTRLGAEQEMFLVDRYMRPAPVSLEVLQQANDPRLTTEIARFNLEANLTPLELTGNCFRRLEQELEHLIELARHAAATQNADVLLSGILPTLQKSDLTLDNLTPLARYRELDRSVIRLRGGPLSIHIKGLDELHLTHDNIMMESCNTSFRSTFKVMPKILPTITTSPRQSRRLCWPSRLIHRCCLVNDCGRRRESRCFSTQQTSAHSRNSRAINRLASTSAIAGYSTQSLNSFTIRSPVFVPS